MTQFITLAGKKQTGKDTSAHMIRELINPSWTCEEVQADPDGYLAWTDRVHVVHFADALKQACSIIFGIPLEDMETETGKQKLTQVRWPKKLTIAELDEYTVWVPDSEGAFMTVREVLQYVGTDLFRLQMDPDIWVQSVYRKKYRDDDIVVVADCRFPNEADFASKHGILISVERDTGLVSDGHKSETALDDYTGYHYIIDNNGSLDELRRALAAILLGNSLTV